MPKKIKEIILGAAVVLSSAVSWLMLKSIFYWGNLSVEILISAFGVFVVWGIALSLAMLLIKDKKILYGSFILSLIIFAMFFNNEPFYYLIAMIILFAAFAVAVIKIKKEEEVQVSLDFYRIWKRGLPVFVTALAIIISAVYYFSPALANLHKKEIIIPRKIFDTIINPFESLIRARLPQEAPSLDEKATTFLKAEEIKTLKDKYGIAITDKENIRDLVYQLAEYQINSTEAYETAIPIGLAIALFLALRIAGIFYALFVILFSWLVLRLLILVKFAGFDKETKEVATVKL